MASNLIRLGTERRKSDAETHTRTHTLKGRQPCSIYDSSAKKSRNPGRGFHAMPSHEPREDPTCEPSNARGWESRENSPQKPRHARPCSRSHATLVASRTVRQPDHRLLSAATCLCPGKLTPAKARLYQIPSGPKVLHAFPSLQKDDSVSSLTLHNTTNRLRPAGAGPPGP